MAERKKGQEPEVKAGAVGYSYIRFSRPEQADGDSIRRQTELTREWCKRNGVRLDRSLKFEDYGVSAYTGAHRDNPDRHALADFLRRVAQKDVAAGSYLIIENLDRLSREHVRAAVKLFLDILDHGINIVTTAPERVFKHDTQDMTDIIIAVVELSRGHSESARRSDRCGRAWRELKKVAARKKVPITHVVPSWVEVKDGRFALIPDKAEAVRLIYQLARDGSGIEAITKHLTATGVPPISTYAVNPERTDAARKGKKARKRDRGDHWTVSYVAHILKTRATMGEYQPMRGKHDRNNPKARQLDGDPVPGYFPAVVTEDEWHATRAAVESRRKSPGRSPVRVVNVFKSLMHDARTRTPMHLMTRGSGPEVIYPYAYTIGQAKFTSFPFTVFEAAVLGQLREVDPRSIIPRRDTSVDRVLTLTGKLADIDGRIAALKSVITDGDAGGIAAVVDSLRELEGRRVVAADELATARRESSTPLGSAWGDAHSLIDVLSAAPDPQEARVRLRASLRRVVSGVWVLIVRRGDCAMAAVQVWFAGGNKHRDFLILYWPPRTGGLRTPRPAKTCVRSFVKVKGAGELDLRDPEHAADLETVLAALDPKELAAAR